MLNICKLYMTYYNLENIVLNCHILNTLICCKGAVKCEKYHLMFLLCWHTEQVVQH